MRWYDPETLKFNPPLTMIKKGLEPADVVCNEPLNKLYRPNSDIPVCVRPQSLEKLIERGWGTCVGHDDHHRGTPYGFSSSTDGGE